MYSIRPTTRLKIKYPIKREQKYKAHCHRSRVVRDNQFDFNHHSSVPRPRQQVGSSYLTIITSTTCVALELLSYPLVKNPPRTLVMAFGVIINKRAQAGRVRGTPRERFIKGISIISSKMYVQNPPRARSP